MPAHPRRTAFCPAAGRQNGMAQSGLGQAAAVYSGPSLADCALPATGPLCQFGLIYRAAVAMPAHPWRIAFCPATGRKSGAVRSGIGGKLPRAAFPSAECLYPGRGLGDFSRLRYTVFTPEWEIYKENKKKTPGKRMFFMLCAIGVSAGPVLAVRHDLLAARHVLNGG